MVFGNFLGFETLGFGKFLDDEEDSMRIIEEESALIDEDDFIEESEEVFDDMAGGRPKATSGGVSLNELKSDYYATTSYAYNEWKVFRERAMDAIIDTHRVLPQNSKEFEEMAHEAYKEKKWWIGLEHRAGILGDGVKLIEVGKDTLLQMSRYNFMNFGLFDIGDEIKLKIAEQFKGTGWGDALYEEFKSEYEMKTEILRRLGFKGMGPSEFKGRVNYANAEVMKEVALQTGNVGMYVQACRLERGAEFNIVTGHIQDIINGAINFAYTLMAIGFALNVAGVALMPEGGVGIIPEAIGTVFDVIGGGLMVVSALTEAYLMHKYDMWNYGFYNQMLGSNPIVNNLVKFYSGHFDDALDDAMFLEEEYKYSLVKAGLTYLSPRVEVGLNFLMGLGAFAGAMGSAMKQGGKFMEYAFRETIVNGSEIYAKNALNIIQSMENYCKSIFGRDVSISSKPYALASAIQYAIQMGEYQLIRNKDFVNIAKNIFGTSELTKRLFKGDVIEKFGRTLFNKTTSKDVSSLLNYITSFIQKDEEIMKIQGYKKGILNVFGKNHEHTTFLNKTLTFAGVLERSYLDKIDVFNEFKTIFRSEINDLVKDIQNKEIKTISDLKQYLTNRGLNVSERECNIILDMINKGELDEAEDVIAKITATKLIDTLSAFTHIERTKQVNNLIEAGKTFGIKLDGETIYKALSKGDDEFKSIRKIINGLYTFDKEDFVQSLIEKGAGIFSATHKCSLIHSGMRNKIEEFSENFAKQIINKFGSINEWNVDEVKSFLYKEAGIVEGDAFIQKIGQNVSGLTKEDEINIVKNALMDIIEGEVKSSNDDVIKNVFGKHGENVIKTHNYIRSIGDNLSKLKYSLLSIGNELETSKVVNAILSGRDVGVSKLLEDLLGKEEFNNVKREIWELAKLNDKDRSELLTKIRFGQWDDVENIIKTKLGDENVYNAIRTLNRANEEYEKLRLSDAKEALSKLFGTDGIVMAENIYYATKMGMMKTIIESIEYGATKEEIINALKGRIEKLADISISKRFVYNVKNGNDDLAKEWLGRVLKIDGEELDNLYAKVKNHILNDDTNAGIELIKDYLTTTIENTIESGFKIHNKLTISKDELLRRFHSGEKLLDDEIWNVLKIPKLEAKIELRYVEPRLFEEINHLGYKYGLNDDEINKIVDNIADLAISGKLFNEVEEFTDSALHTFEAIKTHLSKYFGNEEEATEFVEVLKSAIKSVHSNEKRFNHWNVVNSLSHSIIDILENAEFRQKANISEEVVEKLKSSVEKHLDELKGYTKLDAFFERNVDLEGLINKLKSGEDIIEDLMNIGFTKENAELIRNALAKNIDVDVQKLPKVLERELMANEHKIVDNIIKSHSGAVKSAVSQLEDILKNELNESANEILPILKGIELATSDFKTLSQNYLKYALNKGVDKEVRDALPAIEILKSSISLEEGLRPYLKDVEKDAKKFVFEQSIINDLEEFEGFLGEWIATEHILDVSLVRDERKQIRKLIPLLGFLGDESYYVAQKLVVGKYKSADDFVRDVKEIAKNKGISPDIIDEKKLKTAHLIIDNKLDEEYLKRLQKDILSKYLPSGVQIIEYHKAQIYTKTFLENGGEDFLTAVKSLGSVASIKETLSELETTTHLKRVSDRISEDISAGSYTKLQTIASELDDMEGDVGAEGGFSRGIHGGLGGYNIGKAVENVEKDEFERGIKSEVSEGVESEIEEDVKKELEEEIYNTFKRLTNKPITPKFSNTVLFSVSGAGDLISPNASNPISFATSTFAKGVYDIYRVINKNPLTEHLPSILLPISKLYPFNIKIKFDSSKDVLGDKIIDGLKSNSIIKSKINPLIEKIKNVDDSVKKYLDYSLEELDNLENELVNKISTARTNVEKQLLSGELNSVRKAKEAKIISGALNVDIREVNKINDDDLLINVIKNLDGNNLKAITNISDEEIEELMNIKETVKKLVSVGSNLPIRAYLHPETKLIESYKELNDAYKEAIKDAINARIELEKREVKKEIMSKYTKYISSGADFTILTNYKGLSKSEIINEIKNELKSNCIMNISDLKNTFTIKEFVEEVDEEVLEEFIEKMDNGLAVPLALNEAIDKKAQEVVENRIKDIEKEVTDELSKENKYRLSRILESTKVLTGYDKNLIEKGVLMTPEDMEKRLDALSYKIKEGTATELDIKEYKVLNILKTMATDCEKIGKRDMWRGLAILATQADSQLYRAIETLKHHHLGTLFGIHERNWLLADRLEKMGWMLFLSAQFLQAVWDLIEDYALNLSIIPNKEIASFLTGPMLIVGSRFISNLAISPTFWAVGRFGGIFMIRGIGKAIRPHIQNINADGYGVKNWFKKAIKDVDLKYNPHTVPYKNTSITDRFKDLSDFANTVFATSLSMSKLFTAQPNVALMSDVAGFKGFIADTLISGVLFATEIRSIRSKAYGLLATKLDYDIDMLNKKISRVETAIDYLKSLRDYYMKTGNLSKVSELENDIEELKNRLKSYKNKVNKLETVKLNALRLSSRGLIGKTLRFASVAGYSLLPPIASMWMWENYFDAYGYDPTVSVSSPCAYRGRRYSFDASNYASQILVEEVADYYLLSQDEYFNLMILEASKIKALKDIDKYDVATRYLRKIINAYEIKKDNLELMHTKEVYNALSDKPFEEVFGDVETLFKKWENKIFFLSNLYYHIFDNDIYTNERAGLGLSAKSKLERDMELAGIPKSGKFLIVLSKKDSKDEDGLKDSLGVVTKEGVRIIEVSNEEYNHIQTILASVKSESESISISTTSFEGLQALEVTFGNEEELLNATIDDESEFSEEDTSDIIDEDINENLKKSSDVTKSFGNVKFN